MLGLLVFFPGLGFSVHPASELQAATRIHVEEEPQTGCLSPKSPQAKKLHPVFEVLP